MIRRRTARAFLFCLVGAAMAAACLDQPLGGRQPIIPVTPVVPVHTSNRPSVAAALHLHGWTNHSANSRPASMMWHTLEYSNAGVGVLWWTDHSEFFSRHYPDMHVSPVRPPTPVDAQTWVIGQWGPGNAGVMVVRFGRAGGSVQASGSDRIAITLPGGMAPDTAEVAFGIVVDGLFQRAPYGALTRPLVSDPRFRFTIWRDSGSGRFPDLDAVVPLAWHPRGDTGYREVLQYRFSDTTGVPLAASDSDTVQITRGWPTSDSLPIEFAPLADAGSFDDALDNTTDQYLLRFTRRSGVPLTTFTIQLPTIVNQVSGAATQIASAIAQARASGAAYGVHEIVGIEAGQNAPAINGTPWDSVSGAGRHIAVYFPADVTAGFLDSIPSAGEPTSFIPVVQAAGGIVSIAHPFGTQIGVPTSSGTDRQAGITALGSLLVQHGAWGADLIEVGYWVRGGYYLRDHMNLLDYLLANGIHICGVAATDAHGGFVLQDPVLGTEDEYNFVTWIGNANRATTPAGLITSLRSCNESFGDPFYVHGGMWIAVRADSLGQTLDLDFDGVSPSAQFYVFEAEVDSTGTPHAPHYRSFGKLVPRASRLVVGGCLPGFARMEAWDGTRPLGFSNVVTVAPDPNKCGPGPSPARR